jgi:DNA-binding MarR family transcriptional regulator
VTPPTSFGTQDGDHDPIGVVEMELLTLVRILDTLGRKSALYDRVDRAGYLALRTLDRLGPVPTHKLATALHLDASTITRQVTALVASGFVERQPNPEDGRSSDLAITELGAQVMEDVGRERRRVLDELFEGWSERERRTLGRSLTHLNLTLGDRVSALCADPRPEGAT